MKIKITTFNCLAWKWAKKYRTLAAFKPEVADWSEKEWKYWQYNLDDYQLFNRYKYYIEFFLKEKGFFCLQEVDKELFTLIGVNCHRGIKIVSSAVSYYTSPEAIGNVIIYVEDSLEINYLRREYDPEQLSIMYTTAFKVGEQWFPMAQINISPGKTFWLLNVHMPGYDRNGSLVEKESGAKRIREALLDITFAEKPLLGLFNNLIIAGDFNIDVKKDWYGNILLAYLEKYDMSYYPLRRAYRDVTEPSTGTVIDYIWINEEMVSNIDPVDPITVPGSDHKAVSISFEI